MPAAGFNDTPTAGCPIIGYDSKRAAPNFPPAGDTLLLVPARITSTGAATDPDQVTIFYGSKPHIVNATTLATPMGTPTDNLNVRNPYGYRPGDLILLQDPGTPKNCSIMEVTATPASVPPPPAPGNVVHGIWTYTVLLGAGVAKTPRFNPVGGLGVFYNGTGANATLVFNLGNIYEPANSPDLPVHNTYAIANRSLQVTSLFVPTLPTVNSPQVNTVADNIVHMRALYGIDTGPYDVNGYGDGIVDNFVDAATFNGMTLNGFTPPWRYVIAVRVALVARSALAEKPSEGASGCDATTDGSETPPGADRRPKWSGGVFNLTADPDWKCYRYRVFETTVPLRNWIWRSN